MFSRLSKVAARGVSSETGWVVQICMQFSLVDDGLGRLMRGGHVCEIVGLVPGIGPLFSLGIAQASEKEPPGFLFFAFLTASPSVVCLLCVDPVDGVVDWVVRI